jgi:hypothetical protein
MASFFQVVRFGIVSLWYRWSMLRQVSVIAARATQPIHADEGLSMHSVVAFFIVAAKCGPHRIFRDANVLLVVHTGAGLVGVGTAMALICSCS